MDMILHRSRGSGFHVAWGIFQREGLLGFWRGNGRGFCPVMYAACSYKQQHADGIALMAAKHCIAPQASTF